MIGVALADCPHNLEVWGKRAYDDRACDERSLCCNERNHLANMQLLSACIWSWLPYNIIVHYTTYTQQGQGMQVHGEFPPEVAAWLQTVDEQELLFLSETEIEEEDERSVAEMLQALHKTRPFKDIKDPVAWQREIRKDRDLPNQN